MNIDYAQRIKRLPPYLFKEIDRMKDEVRARGVDIIDLGVGDPDLPTTDNVIDALTTAVRDPATHRYPSYSGMNLFREAAARWYKRRFDVDLDAATEVIALIGSKEGIANIPLAFIDPGDVLLHSSPCYPVYHSSTLFAGGQPYPMDLTARNDFLPDLGAVPQEILDRAKMMFVNYPNNPTAACCGLDFFREVAEFGRKNNIIVCHDAAYTEMYYDDFVPPSFLQVEGAKEVGVEFHSLSKTYNMTGWRLGFAVGHPEVIAGLGKVKSNIDSGAFNAIQIAGVEALAGDQSAVKEMQSIYRERRNILVQGLKELGLEVELPKATFYVWVKTPKSHDSASFAKLLLEKAGVVVTPGAGFGQAGEGYVRFALTVDKARIGDAAKRIKECMSA